MNGKENPKYPLQGADRAQSARRNRLSQAGEFEVWTLSLVPQRNTQRKSESLMKPLLPLLREV